MKSDLYKKLNQLIKELRASGKIRLADILDHRTNKVAWTTSSGQGPQNLMQLLLS